MNKHKQTWSLFSEYWLNSRILRFNMLHCTALPYTPRVKTHRVCNISSITYPGLIQKNPACSHGTRQRAFRMLSSSWVDPWLEIKISYLAKSTFCCFSWDCFPCRDAVQSLRQHFGTFTIHPNSSFLCSVTFIVPGGCQVYKVHEQHVWIIIQAREHRMDST